MCNPYPNFKGGSSPSMVDGIEYLTTYPISICCEDHLDSTVDMSTPIDFALFGLDRMGPNHWPEWKALDFSKPVLDLGPGRKVVPGAQRLDWPEYDWEPSRRFNHFNFNETRVKRPEVALDVTGYLPFEDNAVGGIVAANLLEHLWDPRPLIWECARVLAPGAPFNIFVPHADSIMNKQDLDHKRNFILDTWTNLLSNGYYEKGHADGHKLRVGVNFIFAIKEGNEACVTQLIKE